MTGAGETIVGVLAEVWRYPVKSMAGESLPGAEVGWHGIAGDRRWSFIRPGQRSSGFPWLTIRDVPQMWHYRPRLTDPDRPDASAIEVTTPDGRTVTLTDQALHDELGEGVTLMKQSRGTFDVAPVSVLTRASVAGVEAMTDLPLQAIRFRPNFVISTHRGDYPEAGWVGGELRIGTAGIRVDQRDVRCVMVNVDPETAERDPRVLRAIASEQDNRLGVYGSVVTRGHVTVGDEVVLVGR